MILHTRIIIACALGTALVAIGCGNKQSTSAQDNPEEVNKRASSETTGVVPPVSNPGTVAAPPPSIAPPPSTSAQLPPALVADPLARHRQIDDKTGHKKGDLETLQAIVDGYAFGRDGLGAPPIKDLTELVTKGYLKQIPAPPPGKKWAYDPEKWKVSLVNQ